MPYVTKENREKFIIKTAEVPINKSINPMEYIGEVADCAGDLNYTITVILKKYLEQKGGDSYSTHNEIIGMLDCCKEEWRRRRLNPYEDSKIQQNGDV